MNSSSTKSMLNIRRNLLPFLLVLFPLLSGCATRVQYVPAPCPKFPPPPKLVLPAPGDLSADLEAIISGPKSNSSKPN